MKAVNSSYSSPSFLHLMIPQFHSLSPLETTLSEHWSKLPFQSDSSGPNVNKASSPPISVTPSSVCTDFSDNDFHPIDLTYSRKFSLSTPPLSNVKSESIDSTEFSSSTMKSEPSATDSKVLLDRDKPLKKRSNFTIEHLLSTSCPSPVKDNGATRTTRAVQSIFNKKKTTHFSDQYLHRIISRRKPMKSEWSKRRTVASRRTPREKFLSFIFDSFKDLINSQTQQIDEEPEKFSSVDALERLADIACKLDARQRRSIFDHRDPLTRKTYEHWLKQCHDLVKQIYQKFQQKKLPKRLDFDSKAKVQRRHLLHVPKSISNLLKMQKNFLPAPPTNYSDCLTSTRSDSPVRSAPTICSHLKPNEIRANVEILLPNNDLVYEGTIQPVDQHDDLFLIRLNQERQMYLIPRHDLCRLACPKQIPSSLQMLHEGSRVCALWSESLRGLHPAYVKKMPAQANDSAMIELIFDDLDSGLIKLNEIRLLPEDFQIKGVDLEEWRVSSFQIPPSISDGSPRRHRRLSSASTSALSSSLTQKTNLNKKPPKSADVIPSWTLNTRTATISRRDTKEIIRVGDCAVLHGADKSLSYIGKVLKFYRNRSTEQDLVRLQWYYSPEEIPQGHHKNNLPGALFESTHIDENAIATVRFKGTISSSYDEYVKKTNYGEERQETEFYLVGQYDPTTGELKRFDTNKSKKRRNH